MVQASDHPSLLDRIRSTAHVSNLGFSKTKPDPVLPVSEKPNRKDGTALQQAAPAEASGDRGGNTDNGEGNVLGDGHATANGVPDESSAMAPPPAPPPLSEEGSRGSDSAIDHERKELDKPNVAIRFYRVVKDVLCSSIFNILLVFVPVGIAIEFTNISPTVVFAINAIALVPLAGLLAHATESVASRLGDTVGALLNVTFGNAVELIIFIIALTKNELAVVQASLVGSILSNLLLILGMCFLFGGLRFREQIYNIAVTQMSACLLSLSVTSLLLPTAFHASFSQDSSEDASVAVVAISRGSSIILLLVYILYLLFQLKSHAYMYESTPQHVIDEESQPGVLADMLNSSSSSDSSSSSSNLSDSSSGSQTTAKRIRRAFRGRRQRKLSTSSRDAPSTLSAVHTPSEAAFSDILATPSDNGARTQLGAIASGDEADDDELRHKIPGILTAKNKNRRDKPKLSSKSPEVDAKGKTKKKGRFRNKKRNIAEPLDRSNQPKELNETARAVTEPHVTFAADGQPDNSVRKPFMRSLTRPTMPKMLSSTVFSTTNPTGAVPTSIPTPSAVPRAPYGLRRTTSLPDRLNRNQSAPAARPLHHIVTPSEGPDETGEGDEPPQKNLSRTSAVLLLLISTGLVAVCAEFLVGSIDYLVSNTNVNPAFIGLIILPIVGNAAEHVTAVTVASKNKMDLAIGVAVGSSIQIALFVTPVIVLLGWILNKDMSLYFTLFETVSLFASTFIVNFLVLDGRSNYLEGALLIAAYTIIAVAAFFYPDASRQSSVGGAEFS